MIPARTYTAEPPCSVLHSLVCDRVERERAGMRSDNPLRLVEKVQSPSVRRGCAGGPEAKGGSVSTALAPAGAERAGWRRPAGCLYAHFWLRGEETCGCGQHHASEAGPRLNVGEERLPAAEQSQVL